MDIGTTHYAIELPPQPSSAPDYRRVYYWQRFPRLCHVACLASVEECLFKSISAQRVWQSYTYRHLLRPTHRYHPLRH